MHRHPTQRHATQRSRQARCARGESGASLALALLFLTVASLILVPLASWTANDLNNATNFAAVRSLQADVGGATQTAIQNIRYSPLLTNTETLNASPPSFCLGTAANPVSVIAGIDGQPAIAVWCSTAWTPAAVTTRVVTLSACKSTVAAATCALNPVLQAVVTFDDYAAGVNSPTVAQCFNTCGTVATVNSWIWAPTVPTVTGLSETVQTPTQNPITGGTSLTITGTGLLTAEAVNFIEESGGVPVSTNVVVPATSFTPTSATTITAVAPAVTDGTTYFVAVTTPTGTSAYGPAGTIFTYNAVPPTVNSLSTMSGSTSGGSSETISGTGFVTGTTVNFVPQAGGPGTPAPYVVVASPTSITAVSPAVTSATTYYVTVTTPQGTSGTGPSVLFTYTFLTPTVASISPSQGPSGTSVTIVGTGFVSNATVAFVQESGGAVSSPSVAPTATVTAVGPTSLTVTAPALTQGATYYPEVTNPTMGATGTSDPYPVFTVKASS